MWSMHTVEHYLLTWINTENVMPGERSQSQTIIILIYLYELFRTSNSIQKRSRLIVAYVWGRWKDRKVKLKDMRFLIIVIKML